MRKLNLGCGFDHREGFVNAAPVEAAPANVLENVSKQAAEDAKKKLEEAAATVTIK